MDYDAQNIKHKMIEILPNTIESLKNAAAQDGRQV